MTVRVSSSAGIAVDRVAECAQLHPEPLRALKPVCGEVAARVEITARADERFGLELKNFRIVRRLNARREIGRIVDARAIEQFGQPQRVERAVGATGRECCRRQQNLAQKEARGGRRRGGRHALHHADDRRAVGFGPGVLAEPLHRIERSGNRPLDRSEIANRNRRRVRIKAAHHALEHHRLGHGVRSGRSWGQTPRPVRSWRRVPEGSGTTSRGAGTTICGGRMLRGCPGCSPAGSGV